eukprot:GHVP01052013.1.p1 GENE.GHVP01052013.1~~GHVP01052013.1.p1  ORF type:complete len:138 (+),score=24.54 GHVP01052013.1:63-416(+)
MAPRQKSDSSAASKTKTAKPVPAKEVPAPKVRKAAKAEAAEKPKLPKRATTAYFAFTHERRAKLLVERPELQGKPVPEIAKILGDEWKSMSDKDKMPYVKIAEKDKERYTKEKAALG